MAFTRLNKRQRFKSWIILVLLLLLVSATFLFSTEQVTAILDWMIRSKIPKVLIRLFGKLIVNRYQKPCLARGFKLEESEQDYKYPWELCQPMKYFSDNDSQHLKALASFPGSGNTWTRYLLQQSTGIHTGSEGCGKELVENGFPGEAVADASVSVVKTHGWGSETRDKYRKAVLIVRDPGAAILANFNRIYGNGGHTSNAGPASYVFWWKKFFYEQLPGWTEFNLDWLQNFKGPLHVLMYEDLVNNLEMTLKALITFLELPVDEEAFKCTLQRSEGTYHRQKLRYRFQQIDSEMLDRIKREEAVVYEELKKRRNKLIV